METIHVLPVNDLIEHDESETCACSPRIETVTNDAGLPVGKVVVHNAYDQREKLEAWQAGKTDKVQ